MELVANELPLVTIVTPSYNQGRFIRETIESVLTQDYPNVEYIVMDGASTDETLSILREYESRLTWVSEPDRGQSHAINKGFRMAKGQIVAWLNSDDLFLPGAISTAVRAFLEEPDLGFVYGEGYLIDVDGNVKSRFPVTEDVNVWKLVYMSDYILQQTVFFRRAVFEEVGYIDESLHYGMDWELFMRIAKREPIRYIPQYMGSLREHDEAKTSSGGPRRFRELAAILRRHTGVRFPPGYIVYGLDTYYRVWCDWIRRFFPAPLRRVSEKLQRIVTVVCHRLIGRTARDAQGWYSDGWAAPKVHCLLPPANGRFVELDVSLPSCPISRQTVSIKVGRRVLARESFDRGDFRLYIPVPPDLWHAPLLFQICARRHFVPAAAEEARDPRRLSYLLRSARYAAKP